MVCVYVYLWVCILLVKSLKPWLLNDFTDGNAVDDIWSGVTKIELHKNRNRISQGYRKPKNQLKIMVNHLFLPSSQTEEIVQFK